MGRIMVSTEHISNLKQIISNIDNIKHELEVMSRDLIEAPADCVDSLRAKIMVKMALLNMINKSLELSGRRGRILSDFYFLNLSDKDIAKKHNVRLSFVKKCKDLDELGLDFWEDLVVLFYGADSLVIG